MAEAAPLTAIPDAPVPQGGRAEWFDGADGARLRAALFPPKGPARGSVVLSGGRTEPIEKYFELVGELQARGFVVLVHDWRGQGLSQRALPDRLRGHAIGYEPFLEDYRLLLAAYEDRLPRPWIAVGHSMGGCLNLLALAKGEAARFAACLVTAPMLAIKAPIPLPVGRALAGFFGRIGQAGGYTLFNPGRPFDQVFPGNILTHDEARFLRHRRQIDACRDLALGATTWGWLDFAIKAMDFLNEPANLAPITLPVTVLLAEEDSLVQAAPQHALAAHLPQGKLVEVAGARHEILMETDERRAVFWREFDLLADRVAPAPRASARSISPSA
jgi:lysophospholipase